MIEIFGITKIAEKDILFTYNCDTEAITLCTDGMSSIIPQGINHIVGNTINSNYGNKVFYKLDSELTNSASLFTKDGGIPIPLVNQTHHVEYRIEDYNLDTTYSKMILKFDELNSFLPSKHILAITDDGLLFKRSAKPRYTANIRFNDTTIDIHFECITKYNLSSSCSAYTMSRVVVSFPPTKDINYIIDLFECLHNFFSFVYNRKNISLLSAELVGTYIGKTVKDRTVTDVEKSTNQSLIFTNRFTEPKENKFNTTINISSYEAKLENLMQLFFNEKKNEYAKINAGSIHESTKCRNLINLEQSLNITSTFEFYVRELLPSMSSKESDETYNDIYKLLDEYISTVAGIKKKKAKSIKSSLRPIIPLKSKVEKVYSGYSTWPTLSPVLSSFFPDDIPKLAQAANLWRNELAHEKRTYDPDVNTIKAVRLIEYLNYCIILRLADYSDDEIKKILEETLS